MHEVLIQGVNVLKPFKIENDNKIYKLNGFLQLLYYSYSSGKWESTYVSSLSDIIYGLTKIRQAVFATREDLALLENLYLFNYTDIVFEDGIWCAYESEGNAGHIVLNSVSQYENIVKLLDSGEEYQYKMKDILKEIGSSLVGE